MQVKTVHDRKHNTHSNYIDDTSKQNGGKVESARTFVQLSYVHFCCCHLYICHVLVNKDSQNTRVTNGLTAVTVLD